MGICLYTRSRPIEEAYSFKIWYRSAREEFWEVTEEIFSKIDLYFLKKVTIDLKYTYISGILYKLFFQFPVIFEQKICVFYILLERPYFHLGTIVNSLPWSIIKFVYLSVWIFVPLNIWITYSRQQNYSSIWYNPCQKTHV